MSNIKSLLEDLVDVTEELKQEDMVCDRDRDLVTRFLMFARTHRHQAAKLKREHD